jgi:hypothetical protein
MPRFSKARPSKIYPNYNFWFENKPSGNPVERMCVAQFIEIVQEIKQKYLQTSILSTKCFIHACETSMLWHIFSTWTIILSQSKKSLWAPVDSGHHLYFLFVTA